MTMSRQTMLRNKLLIEDWQGNSPFKLKFQFVDSAINQLQGKNVLESGIGMTEAQQEAVKISVEAALRLVEPLEKCFKIRVMMGNTFIEDGSIIQLIRNDIEQCIENGTIVNPIEGEKRLDQYRVLLVEKLNAFRLTDFNADDVANEIKKITNAVIAKRDEMGYEPSKESKIELTTSEIPGTPTAQETPKKQIINEANFEQQMAARMKNLIDTRIPFVNKQLRAESVEELSIKMKDNDQTQYGTLMYIISVHIKESMKKGYIQSPSQLSQCIAEYEDTVKKILDGFNNKFPPEIKGRDIADRLQEGISQKKDEINLRYAKEEAKGMYAETYQGIKTANKLFVSTRRMFSSSLKKQEQKMTALGITPDEMKTFKKELQLNEIKEQKELKSKSLSTSTPASKADTTKKSTDTTSDQSSKQRLGR